MKKPKELIKNLSRKGLRGLERTAEKKASKECSGFLYEPKLPQKLRKTVTMALVAMLTVVSILAGEVTTYKAADYNYKDWSIMIASPASTTNFTTVSLYVTDENYQWAVTKYQTASGYGMVTISGLNNTVVSSAGNTSLTQTASKKFKITNVKTTDADRYARFKISMSYDSWVTSYSGYVKIV